MADQAYGSDILRALSPEEMTTLKECLIEMYLDVAAVCEKHGLCIMLGGGSALGAVRHQGFIPWDDDLDLLMPRSDYEKLAGVFQDELSEKYTLVAPNRPEPAKARFPKIIKKNTTLKELTDLDSDLPSGIFLDIFILENVPGNPVLRSIKGILCSGLMYMSSCAYWYEHGGDAVRRYMCGTTEGAKEYRKRRTIGKICSLIPSHRRFNMVDRAVRYKKETGLLGIPTGRKHYFGEILPTSVYLPVTDGTFEGHNVKIPGGYDKYLRNLYGNYMEIPPVEKRERHLIVEFSVDNG
jgi:lipopolysaccharide cholinephosphotransferase